MYRWRILSVMLFAVLFTLSFGGSSANAASLYDSSYITTDTLDIGRGSCGTVDATLDWYTRFGDFQYKNDVGYTSLTTAMNNDGRWGVSIDDAQWFYIFWTEDNSLYLEWTETDVKAKGNNLRLVGFYLDSNCTSLQAPIYNTNLTNGTSISQANGNLENLFVYTDYENIPIDYEGEPVQQEVIEPVPPLTWQPDINTVSVADWEITLQDRNFNTFDPVPFTCNEGLTPIIQYDLINNTTSENLDQGVFSPTVPYTFNAEKYGSQTEFKFIANYYCGDLPDDPTFSMQTTHYFTANAAGHFVPDMPSCFQDTFPYVDMDGCTSVVESLVNNLSFGAVTFPDWSIESDECHTLTILGDWINVPQSSRTICPAFPSEIRSVVTPFLTFVLGLTVIGVIVTKSQKDVN